MTRSFFGILAACLLICNCGVRGVEKTVHDSLLPDKRVIGGVAVPITQFPHQLSLEKLGRHLCGASIVSRRYALTAAHCVVSEKPAELRLRSGSSYIGFGGVLYSVANIYVHPNRNGFDYDIALVSNTQSFLYGSTTQPIAVTYLEPSAGDILTVSGWGTTSEGGSLSNQLRATTVPVVARLRCKVLYTNYGYISNRMFCAGFEGRDACQGDSGGPIIRGDVLVGVVSWGAGCARAYLPGVYTNLADAKIRMWIQGTTGM